MADVSLENVSKVYDGGITGVSNFSLDVADGEFMVIVGPSGSGKTTTLRIIAGLEKPDSGNVRIAGKPVNDLPPRKRNIAMVFQNYALYPHMSVRRNIEFALKMRKVARSQIKARVMQTAELLGIEQLLSRKPRTLSGGQRQRVALARAIVRNPQAFLFDEPLSNLDAQLREGVRAELKALHRRLAATSIYVTHDQAEAMTLGRRMCVLRAGRVQQVGPPMQVYEHPVNRFVAELFGTPGMNFFEGRVTFDGDRVYFSTAGVRIALAGRFKAILAGHRDRELVLGLRPQALSLRAFGGEPHNKISAAVEVVEPLGIRTDVCLAGPGGVKFTAALEPHAPIKPGQSVQIHINTDKIQIFEPGETGKNLTSAEKK